MCNDTLLTCVHTMGFSVWVCTHSNSSANGMCNLGRGAGQRCKPVKGELTNLSAEGGDARADVAGLRSRRLRLAALVCRRALLCRVRLHAEPTSAYNVQICMQETGFQLRNGECSARSGTAYMSRRCYALFLRPRCLSVDVENGESGWCSPWAG